MAIQRAHDIAFDVERVTKLFYEDYRKCFFGLQSDLCGQTENLRWAHDFSLQFLNRCMFIYFVQRKRWLNDDPNFFDTLWNSYRESNQPQDSFHEKWLKVLFFEAFNNRFHGGHRYFPATVREAFVKMPYLNGGLFSETELDREFDGEFVLSDARFGQIIAFLDRYNFTISEDTPLDQEVAVDAEMLGKVYESLVNVSEQTDERGDAGIFYTPRIEIDMMCRLALVDFLVNHLGAKHKSLLYEIVFAYTDDEKRDADEQLLKADLCNELQRLLADITVVDPACGSGSFLIGMLQILDDLLARLADLNGEPESQYDRRKRIIGRSLYGVDVMRWAVEVAELRLWLQLIIETDMEWQNLQARPLLPNLSFKVRCGDSLVQELGAINLRQFQTSETRDISQTLRAKIQKLKAEKLKHYHNDETGFKSKKALEQDEMLIFREILEEPRKKLIEDIKHRQRELKLSDESEGLFGVSQQSVGKKERTEALAERGYSHYPSCKLPCQVDSSKVEFLAVRCSRKTVGGRPLSASWGRRSL